MKIKKHSLMLGSNSISILMGILLSTIIVIAASAIIAFAILSGKINENYSNILSKGVLLLSSFIGVKTVMRLNKSNQIFTGGLYAFFMIMLQITIGLLINNSAAGTIFNTLFTALGSCAGLLLSPRKNKKNNYVKKRYR